MRGRAVVLREVARGPELEIVDVDRPQRGEVLVRVVASGVCGSDLHALHGRGGSTALPMVMGHEGAGIVEQVGADVLGLIPGDHVVIALYGPCGDCASCRAGRFVLCDGAARRAAIAGRMADGSSRITGQDGMPVFPMVGAGTLGDYEVIRASQLVRIDPAVPLDRACLVGCSVTTGVGAAVNHGRVQPGDRVIVLGCGGVGLSAIQGARLAGATVVIASDTNLERLAVAKRVGATHVLDPNEHDVGAAVQSIAPGGVDVSFEIVGSPTLVAFALELTRPGGLCVMVGAPEPGVELRVDARVLFNERRLVGSIAGSSVPAVDIPRNIAYYQQGALDLDALVTRTWPLEAFADAILAAETGQVARAVVTLGD